MTDPYTFDGLPVEPVRPGSTLLVCGSRHDGARDLTLSMLRDRGAEGRILVTTDNRAEHVVDDCQRLGVEPSEERTGVVDCVGDGEADVPARVSPVSAPTDLTGIGIRYGDLFRKIRAAGYDQVRTGLVSATTLLSLGEFRSVSRFVHTLAGRIGATDGLGALLVDPTTQDERVINTLGQFCDGRVDVRYGDDGPELRVRGLSGQPRNWTPFDPEP